MANKLHDNVSRVKNIDLLGTATFVSLRAVDVAFRYLLLNDGWATIRRIGATELSWERPATVLHNHYHDGPR